MSVLGLLLGLALSAGPSGAAATGSASSPAAVAPSPLTGASGFAGHLRDAIALNRERRSYYENLSGGASVAVSNRLIAQERMALLAAGTFDDRARPFEAQGVPVVSGSFVSMSLAPPAATPCIGAAVADAAILASARGLLAEISTDIHAALKQDDFRRVAEVCERALVRLEELEIRSGSHFAMCRHIVESLGFGAVVAIDCAARTGGATAGLSRDLVAIQTLALGGAVETDSQAQAIQARGIGILVNDLPPIPFLTRWHALQAGP